MFSIQEITGFVKNSVERAMFTENRNAVYEPVSYMLSLGGKRLRPMLCLLSYNLFSNQIDNKILWPALGLEIFHNFTLIHDDIMDQADMRRNQPTVHKKWNVNAAVLSGDVMCIKAYHYMSQCRPEVLPAVLEVFNRVAAQVCEGQQLDMDYERQAVVSQMEYDQMIRLKTAVLICGAVEIGGVCGDASAEQLRCLRRFGMSLGMGFQVQDDLLDAFGQPTAFGKAIGGDILNNKKTWLRVYAMSAAQGEDAKTMQALFSNSDFSPEKKIEEVLAFYSRLGVKEAAEACIQQYFQEAMDALEALDIPAPNKEVLAEYARLLLNRNR